MIIYLYYTAATILLALLDYARIRQVAGVVANINHKLSGLFAFIAALAIGLIFTRPILQWGALLFIPGFLSIRGLVYDLVLNKLRGLDWDYVSAKTDAKTDGWMNRFNFWTQRIIYASILAIVLLINYLFI